MFPSTVPKGFAVTSQTRCETDQLELFVVDDGQTCRIRTKKGEDVLVSPKANALEIFPTWDERGCAVEILERNDGKEGKIIHLSIPLFFAVNIDSPQSAVVLHDKVESTEGSIRVTARSIRANKLRAETIVLRTTPSLEAPNNEDGHINIHAVAEGSLEIECGVLTAKQLLGSEATIRTNECLCTNERHTAIDVAALYVDRAQVNSRQCKGNVRFGTVQGDCAVECTRDLSVGSVVGQLVARSVDGGNVSAHLDKCVPGVHHDIRTSGRVDVTAAVPCVVNLDISADTIDLSDPSLFRGTNDGTSASGIFVATEQDKASSRRSSGKISPTGRHIAALKSAKTNAADEGACVVCANASNVSFRAKSWREMMTEKLLSKATTTEGA